MRSPGWHGSSALLAAVLLAVSPRSNAAASGAAELAGRPDLTECRVIVTGTDLRSRPAALATCVREVIAKVTGRPDAADGPRLNTFTADPASMVEDVTYLDRMTDIPLHDEQGSRDRPYDLIAHVNPVALVTRLEAAGLRPWLARPTLLALVTVSTRDGIRFPLAGDGEAGERLRQALLAAGRTYGLRVALPPMAAIGRFGLDKLTPATLHIGNGGPAVALRGSLRWSDPDFGWVADWTIDLGARPETWQVRGVAFDEAFRSGVGGAARALSQVR